MSDDESERDERDLTDEIEEERRERWLWEMREEN